ncbi:MAG: glutamate racemase [Desulfocapsaceae bacterium]|jgi:glutamate racemase|nr:glutamate racemase [Desulfocapsaceae bacterium]
MIGIFDSGIGGMTVARAVEQLLPDYSIVYFGDIARTPYGSKSAATITDYSLRNTEFLLKKGAEIIIIACNTASSVATEALRREFQVPIIEVITPAATKAIATTKTGRIGVIGTRATIRSGVYEQTICGQRPDFHVFSEACPLLVPLVEEGWTNKQETKMIIRRYLHPLKDKQIDTLVLGCTHYPLLTQLIQTRVGKRVTLIDSSVETAKYVRDLLTEQPQLIAREEKGIVTHRYFVSDLTDAAKTVARKIFARPLELILT